MDEENSEKINLFIDILDGISQNLKGYRKEKNSLLPLSPPPNNVILAISILCLTNYCTAHHLLCCLYWSPPAVLYWSVFYWYVLAYMLCQICTGFNATLYWSVLLY